MCLMEQWPGDHCVYVVTRWLASLMADIFSLVQLRHLPPRRPPVYDELLDKFL